MRKRAQHIASEIYRFWWGQGLAHQVPALAFYLVLSLAPLTLGLATVSSLLLGDSLHSGDAAEQLAHLFPANVHRQLLEVTEKTRNSSTQLLAVSLLSMFWILSGALGVIERAMTSIGTGRSFGFVWGRIRLLLLSALLVALVIAFVSGSVLAGGIADDVASFLHVDAEATRLGLAGGNVFLTALAVTLVYRLAPRDKPAWKSSARASFPAAAILLGTPYIVGRYFALGAHLSAVGIFLSLAVVLTSCLMISYGLLLGAGLAAGAARVKNQRSTLSRPSPGTGRQCRGR